MFVDTKLRDNINDMIAYERHNKEENNPDESRGPKDHFQELRDKQKAAQKEFHNKLFNELQKEVG